MSIHLINELFNSPTLTSEDIENTRYHAESGNEEAQYHLGLIYDTGSGVERSPKDAEKWYKRAANQGNVDATYYLSLLYSSQNSGIRRDEKEAHRLLLAAAEQGHPEALKKVAN